MTSGSIASAAANLGYTSSAISQQFTVLEREVGLPLLEKSGRGIRPTSAGFTPDFVVESDDYPTAMAFVASGLGVTLVPRIALGTVPAGVVVRPVRHPQPVRSVYVSVREAVHDTAPVRGLLDALRGAASPGNDG